MNAATADQRRSMVQVIRQHGLRDPQVLDAMQRVPRHLFVPRSGRNWAHSDEPVSIGLGQTISQPYMVAYMTAAAHLKNGDPVLEIGTGSAYQAAVLAALGAEVFTIEIVPELYRRSRRLLRRLHVRHVHQRLGDGGLGWPEAAPFAAILVTAAAPRMPWNLLEQLRDGGRLIVPVGAPEGRQELQVVQRQGRVVAMERALPVRFVPLMGASGSVSAPY